MYVRRKESHLKYLGLWANIIYYTNNNHFLALFSTSCKSNCCITFVCFWANIRKRESFVCMCMYSRLERDKCKCNNANRYCRYIQFLWIFFHLNRQTFQTTKFCSCVLLIHVKTPEHVGLQMNPFTVHVGPDILASYVKVKWDFFSIVMWHKKFSFLIKNFFWSFLSMHCHLSNRRLCNWHSGKLKWIIIRRRWWKRDCLGRA